MASQLNNVRLKLEQRRRRIEEEKKKMESIMARQREKVGQEAFLRAVGAKSANNSSAATSLTDQATVITNHLTALTPPFPSYSLLFFHLPNQYWYH